MGEFQMFDLVSWKLIVETLMEIGPALLLLIAVGVSDLI